MIIFHILVPLLIIRVLQPDRPASIYILQLTGIVAINAGLEYGNHVVEKTIKQVCSKVNRKLEAMLTEKFVWVDYRQMENPEYLDLKSGASFAITNYKVIDNLMQGVIAVICECVVLVFSGAYLLFKYPVLLLLLGGNFLLQLLVNRKLNRRLASFFENMFPVNRRFRWLSSIKYDISRQKDIRQFHMEEMIEKKIDTYHLETQTLFKKMNHLTCKFGNLVDLFSVVMLYIGYVYNILLLFWGKMDAGLMLSMNMLLSQCNSILGNIGDEITGNSQMLSYMKPVIGILDGSSYTSGSGSVTNIQSIEFRDVSFSYPNSGRKALNHISFKVSKTEKIGIVGVNGSGKTTLIKLLCGLYEPDEGCILINGTDIREINKEEYYKLIAAVFQDFCIFDFSIKDNIELGKYHDEKRMRETVQRADLSGLIERLKDGVETNIGPRINENGIYLSGGESQKLAIARALYRESELYIFDEPNSNLDVIAEQKTYRQYNSLVRDKIIFFISHKIGSTNFCDRIFLMEDGEIVEQGKAEDLLKDSGSRFYEYHHFFS